MFQTIQEQDLCTILAAFATCLTWTTTLTSIAWRITEITETKVTFATPHGNKTIPNDYVVALTGYQPDFNFLKNVGITLSDEEKKIPNYNPKTMESNVQGMYLAGVICGGMETHKWFIENSRIHAEIISKHLSSKLH